MNRNILSWASLAILLVFYSGCSSSPPNQDQAQALPSPSSIVSKPANSTSQNNEPETAESSLIIAANSSTQEKDYSKAIVVLERAIRLSPRDPGLWIRLSEGYLQQENLHLAEQYAHKAINLSRNNLEILRAAWLQLAKVLEKMGNLKEASKLRKKYRYKTS